MYERGRHLDISEDRGRQGIRSAADLYNLYKVVSRGGTYISIWRASSGES